MQIRIERAIAVELLEAATTAICYESAKGN